MSFNCDGVSKEHICCTMNKLTQWFYSVTRVNFPIKITNPVEQYEMCAITILTEKFNVQDL
jgi:hypothetical protein